MVMPALPARGNAFAPNHALQAKSAAHALAGPKALLIQRASASTGKGSGKQTAKITAEGLDKDDFLFVKNASGGNAPSLANTTQTMTLRVLNKADVDYEVGKLIEKSLTEPARNLGSIQPVHGNLENRLPMYPAVSDMQPYPEYLCYVGGGSRLVVDAAHTPGRVYLSYHYGDATAKQGRKIDKGLTGVSAHVLLGAGWDTTAILADAKIWWAEIQAWALQ
jgi:hypothetical protein